MNNTPKGNTTAQRDSYELAVARKAAADVRENGESLTDAVDYAFSSVEVSPYFAPTMARALEQASPSDAEIQRVTKRTAQLLTLGRKVDR